LIGLVVILCSLGVPFALVSGGLFVALHLFGVISWKTPAHGIHPERGLSSVRLLLISWAGSFVGVILSFISLISADRWDYLCYPSRVRDGQGDFAIVFSAPASGILGGILAVVVYRVFLCSSLERLWSAPWLYSGNRPIANRAVVSATFAVVLGGLFLCAFLFNWILVHPGPW